VLISNRPLFTKIFKVFRVSFHPRLRSVFAAHAALGYAWPIADHKKIHTPTFLSFVFKFTPPFLLPMLLIVWLLLFRK